MPRGKYKKHPAQPDFVYSNVGVSKFINHIMERGKKIAARKIVYGAFDILKEQTLLGG